MTVYSVWNGAGFDYFEAASTPGDPSLPHHIAKRSGKLGVVAEEAGWPLPAGARKVGSGPMAKGMIAHESLGGLDLPGGNTLLLIGAGIALYFFLKR